MRRQKRTLITSHPARPARFRCGICGRERLSRQEYAWRRKNGYAVWRCQHRRSAPRRGRELAEAMGLVATLTVGALVLAL